MEKIFILTDYKNIFGSKHNATPYRSGMDKDLLKKYFEESNFEVNFLEFSEIDFRKMNFKDKYVLYTSSEDIGYHYKDYIEDIILGLHLQGAILIPEYKYLRANSNKVFMEILRDQMNLDSIKNIKSHHFGTIEELNNRIDEFTFPVVIKSAAGAMSSGVRLAHNKKELIKIAKRLSRTKYLYDELWDYGRSIKHKGYIRESKYRKKFIIQDFTPGLKNDWKILVFGDRYYIFLRPSRKNDFRASGSGADKYIYGKNFFIPDGIFDFAKSVFEKIKAPFLSIDIGYNEKDFYLFEFQVIYFGTVGHERSSCYYVNENSSWIEKKNALDIEKVYVDSIVKFINRKFGGSN